MSVDKLTEAVRAVQHMLSDLSHTGKVEPNMGLLAKAGANMARHLSRRVAKPQARTPGVMPTVYASDIGKECLRQTWFKAWHGHKFPSNIDGPTNWRFMHGDLLEEAVLYMLEQVGADVQLRQHPVEYVLDGVRFSGRIDAVIEGVTVDVKTMSEYAFSKADPVAYPKPGDDPWGYGYQLAFYDSQLISLTGSVQYPPHFLAIDKVHGDMKLLQLDDTYLDTLNIRLESVAHAVGSGIAVPAGVAPVPDKVGKVLHKNCQLCPFITNCWQGQGVKGLVYADGIKWYEEISPSSKHRVPEVPLPAPTVQI